MSTLPTTITWYLARDAAGTQPVTGIFSTPITKALGVAAATTGGLYAKIENDFHSLDGQGPGGINAIYFIAKTDAGTATATAMLSWRT